MTSVRPPLGAAERLPTLTEVVELPCAPSVQAGTGAVPPAQGVPAEAPSLGEAGHETVDRTGPEAGAGPSPGETVPEPAWVDDEAPVDEALVDEVLDAVQRRIDVLYEYRVREALAPVMARLADRVVHELRDALAETVREVVARAVTEELAARRRPRG